MDNRMLVLKNLNYKNHLLQNQSETEHLYNHSIIA